MKIPPKINIGEKYWTIHNLKAVEVEITEININKEGTTYFGETSKGEKVWYIEPDAIFHSKDKLVNHIISEGDE